MSEGKTVRIKKVDYAGEGLHCACDGEAARPRPSICASRYIDSRDSGRCAIRSSLLAYHSQASPAGRTPAERKGDQDGDRRILRRFEEFGQVAPESGFVLIDWRVTV